VKRILVVALILLVALMVFGCSKQRALDRLLADPQAKSYILSEAMKNEQTRAALADSIFADRAMTDRFLNGLVANEYSRSDLISRMLKIDPTGQWIIDKLAEDATIKARMKEASK
jgi:hypothetical protein